MNRPLQTWILFALSLVVAVMALGRVSFAMLNLEESQRRAEEQSQREERVQQALSRVEGVVSLLLAREDARGVGEYEAFVASTRAYLRVEDGFSSEDVLLPSPLLGYVDTNVWLHFELRTNGVLGSPQLPLGAYRGLAERAGISSDAMNTAEVRLARLEAILDSGSANHSESVRQLKAIAMSGVEEVGGDGKWRVGRFIATRTSAELILVRWVEGVADGRLQGCWLDWPGIREGLLRSIADVLPESELRLAAEDAIETGGNRVLRSRGLVLELLPGAVESALNPGWSPVRVTLGLAWVAVICAALAVGLLLNGAVTLSERRAAFVSAVTHELRTPLTTFKMYSEMLAAGMVSDEEQRRRYLETLCAEANRLGHLVENVLAYARIERGSARSRVEPISVGALLEQIVPRLQQRAEQAGTRILSTIGDGTLEAVAFVDASAVEQILFNLIDNACKYGTGARVGAAPIELEGRITGARTVCLRVRDHGPGVSTEVASKLFQPFCKSADEAARSAPGVGLGLALSRRLIRSMGGELEWNAEVREGACFDLTLPRVRRGAEPTIA